MIPPARTRSIIGTSIIGAVQPKEWCISGAGSRVRPLLSIVIPAYNESRRLPRTLERLHAYLQSQPYEWEILVVSNASTDGTLDVVRRAQAVIPGLTALDIPERGKGIATRTGVLASEGEVVFLCDADLSMPAEGIGPFLEAAREAPIVIGSREAPGARRHDEPRFTHFRGRVFNMLVKFVAVPGIEDTQCGFKAFRRTAARELFARQRIDGWASDVEVLYLARKLGYEIKELPVQWWYDADTRVRSGTDSISMLKEVIAVRLNDMLGRYSYSERDIRA